MEKFKNLSLFKNWFRLLRGKSKRTKSLLIGSASMLVSQGLVAIIGIAMTAIVARYFSPREFGLWTLLMSIGGIIAGLDLGFGNALKNKLSKLYAYQNNDRRSQSYFFSMFYFFILWALVLIIFVFVAKSFIPWHVLLKSEDIVFVREGAQLFTIGAVLFSFIIAFSLGGSGFYGYQESHWPALLSFIGKLLTFIVILIFVQLQISFFFMVASIFGLTLFFTMSVFVVFLVKRKWRFIFISLKMITDKIKELLSKSMQFALLQILSVFLSSVDVFLVSKTLGLEIVGEYSLVRSMYLFAISLHMVVLIPLWPAFTEAKESKDYEWIKKILKKTILLTIVFFTIILILFSIFGKSIVFLWTGKTIKSGLLFVLMGIWSLLVGWGNCFSIFLNSVGNLRRQVFIVIAIAIAIIPMSIILIEKYGIIGMCLSLILISLPSTINHPLQIIFIIRGFQRENEHKSGNSNIL